MRFLAGSTFRILTSSCWPTVEHVGRLIDASMRNIGHVQHAVHAADVDKRAVIEQAAHGAVAPPMPAVQRTELLFFGFGALFFEHHAAVDHHIFFFGIELDHPAGDFLADQGLHLGHIAGAAA